MRYGSVCSGIEAATAAWHPLGWEPAFFSEIDVAPRAVLAHHYPDVPLHGRDRRKGESMEAYAEVAGFQTIGADDYGPIDLLVGGTPCQSFSVAGLRGGMADGRGNLALEYIRLAHRKRARWVVWENVPGVFSSNAGEDFRCFLAGLVRWDVPLPEGGWRNSGVVAAGPADGAYGVAWRILDAQHFGVPQRRRRVFVVGYLGDWRRAAAVLFERHSLSGNPPPRRETGERVAGAIARCSFSGGEGGRPKGAAAGHFVGEVAPTPSARAKGGGGLGTDFDCDGGLIAFEGQNLGTFGADQPSTCLDTGSSHSNRGIHVASYASIGAGEYGPGVGSLRAKGADCGGGSETLIHCPDIVPQAMSSKSAKGSSGPAGDEVANLIAHTLRAEGFDAGEDGTGRGVPLVPVCVHADAIGRTGEASTPSPDAEGRVRLRDAGTGILDDGTSYNLTTGQPHAVAYADNARSEVHAFDARQRDVCQYGDISGPLDTDAGTNAICFSAKDHGGDASDIAPTLRAGGHSGSHANAGVMAAVAYAPDVAASLLARSSRGGGQTNSPGHQADQHLVVTSAVRRLTPIECERLQGFPDNFTLVPTGKAAGAIADEYRRWMRGQRLLDDGSYRPFTTAETDEFKAMLTGKWMADGPRYKMLGNSMAIPCMAWIGQRIEAVEAVIAESLAA